jgi:hypothetical protein
MTGDVYLPPRAPTVGTVIERDWAERAIEERRHNPKAKRVLIAQPPSPSG